MSLTNLSQIKGGLQLQKDVQALLKSYDAAKVLTQIAKAGEGAGNYNVEELLKELQEKIAAVANNSAQAASIDELKAAIEALKGKKIKDMVRVEVPVASGVATLPADFDTKVPACDKTKVLPVYSAENEVIFNEKGEQLTIDLATGALNGVPSEVDADASAADAEGKTIYKAKADFTGKIFPVGEFTLAGMPEDALLDNNEMQLVAYKTSLDKLVVELAKDKSLIEQVKNLVGEKAVRDQLDAALKEINDALALKADKTDVEAVDGSVKELDNRLKALEDSANEQEVSEKIAVTAPVTEFALTNKPNDKLVQMVINHLVYHEGEDFTVDRDAQKLTWTLTAANEGFDIDAELTDAVRINYFFKDAGKAVEPTPAPEKKDEPAQDAGKGWEVEINLPSGDTAYPLSNYLTEAQLADLTDENCIGPNGDGEGRKVRLFMGDVEIAWNESCTTHNEEVENALKAAGYDAMDFVFGSYELDEAEKILNFATGARGSKVKLVYRP